MIVAPGQQSGLLQLQRHSSSLHGVAPDQQPFMLHLNHSDGHVWWYFEEFCHQIIKHSYHHACLYCGTCPAHSPVNEAQEQQACQFKLHTTNAHVCYTNTIPASIIITRNNNVALDLHACMLTRLGASRHVRSRCTRPIWCLLY